MTEIQETEGPSRSQVFNMKKGRKEAEEEGEGRAGQGAALLTMGRMLLFIKRS